MNDVDIQDFVSRFAAAWAAQSYSADFWQAGG